MVFFFFFSSRRRHTRYWRDWSSDVCSSDLNPYRREPSLPRTWVNKSQVMQRASLDGSINILKVGRIRKERHEPTVPPSGRHRRDHCAHRRDRRGGHPLPGDKGPHPPPETSQAKTLAGRGRPPGRGGSALPWGASL